jgi:ketosteroid isomerase-like protein
MVDDRVAIIEALARYARALENRDGETLATLFAPDAKVEVFSRYGSEEYESQDVDMSGRDQIRGMVANSTMPPGRGMSYMTTDHIVEITGDVARLQAQFLVISSVANPRPENGWPSGAELMQGALSPIMIGHYESLLRKSGGRWLFTRHRVKHSLPMPRRPV